MLMHVAMQFERRI